MSSGQATAPRSEGRFLWLLLAAALLFSIAWTAAALRRNNVESQGIDIITHAAIVHENALHRGESFDVLCGLERYPRGSHWLAGLFMPLFQNNAIQAMRCAALFVLLVMLVAQYGLLRQMMPGAAAMLVLVAWQALCTKAKVADVNHFLWEGQYNYSRAVGSAAMWLMFLLLAVPAFSERHRSLNRVLVTALAVYAWWCHLASGLIAFGTLGLLYAAALVHGPRLRPALGLLLTGLIMAAAELASGAWQCMVRVAGVDGAWLPIAWEPILALWIPTWAAALVLLWRCVRTAARGQDDVRFVLACALIVSGALQGYLLLRVHVFATAASYAAKSVLFTTFALASLLWIAAFRSLWQRWWSHDGPTLLARINPRAVTAAAAIAAVVGLGSMLSRDVRRPHFGQERDVAQVVRVLSEHRAELADCYYFDPRQPFGSYFASSVGLQRRMDKACDYCFGLVRKESVATVFRDQEVRALLLPAAEDPRALFNADVSAVRFGPFWLCELAEGDAN